MYIYVYIYMHVYCIYIYRFCFCWVFSILCFSVYRACHSPLQRWSPPVPVSGGHVVAVGPRPRALTPRLAPPVCVPGAHLTTPPS